MTDQSRQFRAPVIEAPIPAQVRPAASGEVLRQQLDQVLQQLGDVQLQLGQALQQLAAIKNEQRRVSQILDDTTRPTITRVAATR